MQAYYSIFMSDERNNSSIEYLSKTEMAGKEEKWKDN